MSEQETPKTWKARKGDGGSYLVVADETPEFKLALRYAARLASQHRGHVALLKVIEPTDFQDWGGIEKRMQQELRQKAEKELQQSIDAIHLLTNNPSAIYIMEGDLKTSLLEIVNKDPKIVMLILAGGVSGSGPGPLVQYFTSKGLGLLRVPVAVVPGNLDSEKIDAITL
jgi:hypothetical protein